MTTRTWKARPTPSAARAANPPSGSAKPTARPTRTAPDQRGPPLWDELRALRGGEWRASGPGLEPVVRLVCRLTRSSRDLREATSYGLDMDTPIRFGLA